MNTAPPVAIFARILFLDKKIINLILNLKKIQL